MKLNKYFLSEDIFLKEDTISIIKEILKKLLNGEENFVVLHGLNRIKVIFSKNSETDVAYLRTISILRYELGLNKKFFSPINKKRNAIELIQVLIHELSHYFYKRHNALLSLLYFQKNIYVKFDKLINTIYHYFISSPTERTAWLYSLVFYSINRFKTKEKFLYHLNRYVNSVKTALLKIKDNELFLKKVARRIIKSKNDLFVFVFSVLYNKDTHALKYFVSQIYQNFDKIKALLNNITNKILSDPEIKDKIR